MKKKLGTLTITLLLAITSCSTDTKVDYIEGADIYIAGVIDNGNTYVSGVWKNGVLQKQMDVNLASNILNPPMIVVLDNNIYLAGIEIKPGQHSAAVWKNGIKQDLELSENILSSTTTSIAISGNDVYVAGAEYFENSWHIRMWKNGVKQNLAGGFDHESFPKSITISGNDVYLAGTSNWNQVIWKNGIVQESYFSSESNPEGITAYEGNLYVAGWDKLGAGSSAAVLWINEKKHSITNFSPHMTSSSAQAVTISGNDIIVVGQEHNETSYKAALWINGICQPLDLKEDATSLATSVVVLGEDIYIAGHEYYENKALPVIWKNRKRLPISVPAGNFRFTSMAIVPRDK